MSYITKFLGQVYSDLEGLFPQTKQSYKYYIFFLKENISFINIKALKFKDNILAIFKNYKALHKEQSSCQLIVLHTDGRSEYMGELDHYLKKNDITHKVVTSYSPE